MNVFYSGSKTDLKLRCNCVWISSSSRVPKTILLDWWLYVACYYTTTPTDYPSTKRGMSVGPSVAVNIEFCGYLPFLSISFVWINGYSTPLTTFLVNNWSSLHRPVLIFQPTVNPKASDSENKRVRTVLVHWEKDAVTRSVNIYMCVCRGV